MKLAYDENITILPVICDDGYTKKQKHGELKDASQWPCGWLSACIAGKIYSDFRTKNDFEEQLNFLIERIQHVTSFRYKEATTTMESLNEVQDSSVCQTECTTTNPLVRIFGRMSMDSIRMSMDSIAMEVTAKIMYPESKPNGERLNLVILL